MPFLYQNRGLRSRLAKNNNDMFNDKDNTVTTNTPVLGPSKAEPPMPDQEQAESVDETVAATPEQPAPEPKPLLKGPSVVDPKKAAINDMSRFRQVAEGTETPHDLAGLQEFVTKRFENLDAQDQAWMQNQYGKLQELNRQAAEQYQKDKDSMQWRELASTIVEALGQLGYAYSATKNGGMYAGPLQFKKTDWESKYNRLLGEYKMQLDANKDAVEGESKIEKASSEKRRSESDRQIQLAIQTYQDNLRAARAQAKEIKKSKSPEEEAAKREKAIAAINKRYAAIDSELLKMDDGDQDETKTLANVNRLLGGAGSSSTETLKEKNEERGSDGFNLFGLQIFEQKPDQLKAYIEKLKTEELKALGAPAGSSNTASAAAPAATKPAAASSDTVEIIGKDGVRRRIPRQNLDAALKIPGTKLAE